MRLSGDGSLSETDRIPRSVNRPAADRYLISRDIRLTIDTLPQIPLARE